MRCKNNHTSCEVCINVNMLLSDKSRKWPPAADNIIKHWRHHHLKQRWRERQDADEREERARTETDPATGQPLNFYMCADFVSNSVGDTPLFQKDGRHAKNERSKKHIQTRMCGVHVICGGTIFINTAIILSLSLSLALSPSLSLSISHKHTHTLSLPVRLYPFDNLPYPIVFTHTLMLLSISCVPSLFLVFPRRY